MTRLLSISLSFSFRLSNLRYMISSLVRLDRKSNRGLYGKYTVSVLPYRSTSIDLMRLYSISSISLVMKQLSSE